MKNIVLTEDQCPITTTADRHMVNLLPVYCILLPVSCFQVAMVTAKTHHTELNF